LIITREEKNILDLPYLILDDVLFLLFPIILLYY
jgi:hypothetical protein